MIGCIIVLAVIVGLIAACIFGCGQAKGRSGNVINPQAGQGTYLIRSCTHWQAYEILIILVKATTEGSYESVHPRSLTRVMR